MPLRRDGPARHCVLKDIDPASTTMITLLGAGTPLKWKKQGKDIVIETPRLSVDQLPCSTRTPSRSSLCSRGIAGRRHIMADQLETRRLSVDRIAHAVTVIDPVFLDSPQFRAEPIEKQLGCRLVVKVETLNPIRSFKGRGTEYLTSSLHGHPRLVCATAGNFGQGMAYSARKRGLSLTIFASVTANPLKVERMRALGADVRLTGEDFDAAHLAAAAFAVETGAQLIEDGRDVAIAEGAGTIGVELLRWPEPLDALLVPLGDGALLAGVARWVKTHQPSTQVIGVCASGAPAMERSSCRSSSGTRKRQYDRGRHLSPEPISRGAVRSARRGR